MGRQTVDQSQLFYLFNLERRVPAGHLLRRINPVVTRILVEPLLRQHEGVFENLTYKPSKSTCSDRKVAALPESRCLGARSISHFTSHLRIGRNGQGSLSCRDQAIRSGGGARDGWQRPLTTSIRLAR